MPLREYTMVFFVLLEFLFNSCQQFVCLSLTIQTPYKGWGLVPTCLVRPQGAVNLCVECIKRSKEWAANSTSYIARINITSQDVQNLDSPAIWIYDRHFDQYASDCRKHKVQY